VPVENEDDGDDIEPVQQEPTTNADKDAMDEQPGPSNSKKMKI